MQLVRELTSAQQWAEARNVLAVRLDNMGDVLMTTPALRAIKASSAQRRVTLLTSESGAAVAAHIPEVDEVIRYDAPWVKSVWQVSSLAALRCLSQLTERRFDAAVVFTVYSQSALPAATLTWLAGIPLRLAHCRENPYQLLTDWVSDPEPQDAIRHEVRRQLDLVASVGYTTTDDRLSFHLDEADRVEAMHKLEQAGIDTSRPYVVMHPGATAASRRYPALNFAAGARQLADETGCQILIVGGPEERQLGEVVRLHGPHGAVSLAGELALGELAAAIEQASVLIANNSGPVHIAAAVGTPVVDLYALTNPQHTPWRVLSRVLFHDVPCKYCYKSVCPEQHHACLREVKPQAVVHAARELMETVAQRKNNVRRLPRRPVPAHAASSGLRA
ncbi:MAG TPA: lipopolysaccharide heptosyltransferase II [Burkholderiales bacterium]|nr:lipopolysaccharide heptosyltransferase II [Burkholderiales bacterium]